MRRAPGGHSPGRISAWRHRGHAQLFDFQAGGDVGERNGFFPVQAGHAAQAHHGQHHVAGAGDVVDLTPTRREVPRKTIVLDQHHAVGVELDQHRLGRGAAAQFLAGMDGVKRGDDGEAGGQLRLGAVGKQHRRAPIAGTIGSAAWIDKDGNRKAAGLGDHRGEQAGRTHPLGVIGNKDSPSAADLRQDKAGEVSLGRGGEGMALLAVNAEDLLGMALGGPAHVALLRGRDAVGHGSGWRSTAAWSIEAPGFVEDMPQRGAGGIAADDAGQNDFGVEGAQQAGDAGRAAPGEPRRWSACSTRTGTSGADAASASPQI